MRRLAVLSTVAVILLGQLSFAQEKKSPPQNTVPMVTFIELGSVKCIPCRMMQPVMKSIEAKYGDQIKVIFYDVWKDDQRKYADKYGIRLIPTQVFLDNGGNEILRHEGFFPEKDIDAFLQTKGLRVKTIEKG